MKILQSKSNFKSFIYLLLLIISGCEVYTNNKIVGQHREYLHEQRDALESVPLFFRDMDLPYPYVQMDLTEKGTKINFITKEGIINDKLNVQPYLLERWRTLDGFYEFRYDVPGRRIKFYLTLARNKGLRDVSMVYYYGPEDIKCGTCDSVAGKEGFNDRDGFECALDSHWTVYSPAKGN